MSEVMLLDKDDNIWGKILPVICDGTRIYDLTNRLEYVNFWQNKSSAIEEALKNIDPINATSIYQELKDYKQITLNIDKFLQNIKDKLNTTPDILFKEFYKPITDKIGVEPDFSKMTELLPISLLKDPTLRLLRINNFIQNSKFESTYAFSILASCYKDFGLPKEATKYYKKALALDNYNYSVWNNLGQIYDLIDKNFYAAKTAYEKAIKCKPDLDIPRLNLGVLLANHLKDLAGAKKQYEKILKFDENNPKAHNNLANIYKSKAYLDLDRAEKHLIISVKQNNIEATMNYANFLKVFKKDIKMGNKFYQKAKDLDKENIYSELIDILMKSEKG